VCPFLTFIALTHATRVGKPFHYEGWVYEEKIDGYRMVAKEGPTVRLVSRQNRDHTRRFRALAAAVAALPADELVLDGEVAVFDERHQPWCLSSLKP
jgi:bifunctional non-homologous end joining protein LigD